MPILATSTNNNTSSSSPLDSINYKPPVPTCNECGAPECHDGRPCVSSENKTKRPRTDSLDEPKKKDHTHRPSKMLLNCRKEDDCWVDISTERLPSSRLGSLYPGSQFKGTQRCGSARYEVSVEIQHVDLKESTLSGYLNIKGLTSDYPELTTFFQAEIIGPKYSFLTRKWQAQQYIDVSHWRKFPSFEPYADIFNNDDFVYDPFDKDFIYMRWKEHFLVPDHRVNNIDGASFAGFYYICYQRSTDEIKGYYFFLHHTEWYQELSLKHVEQRSFGNFEMR